MGLNNILDFSPDLNEIKNIKLYSKEKICAIKIQIIEDT